ncbi:hypothetical protein TL16_g04290 [Triparma laevis f. inornata]|uniref:PPM-type phosphatase domain-containing protein n=1 Tax=Triparma laevis f. inornata TaxID=1714386 RepID=A0A9W7ACG5_9STRA|nr:hypothetical protein TL16_g04290 [Triparma laevis f. inornata]
MRDEILSACTDTAFCLSSPTKSWDIVKTVFRICESKHMDEKKLKKINNKFTKHPALLHSRSTNLTPLTPDGLTPLHASCLHSNLPVLQLILQLEPTLIVQKTLTGKTALHVAAQAGFKDGCDYLLSLMINPLAKGVNAPVSLSGETPASLAFWKGFKDLARELCEDGDFGVLNFLDKEGRMFEGKGYRCGEGEIKGWRSDMEDCVFLRERFVGVCDGHGGKGVAEIFVQNIEEKKGETEWKEELERIDELCQHTEGGSTVCVVRWEEEIIECCNLGDSRALVISESGVVQISEEISVEEDRARIEEAGMKVVEGRVERKLGESIAMSRALGDWDYKHSTPKGIVCEPCVKQVKKEGVKFIVVACDGIWDVMKNEDVEGFVKGFKWGEGGGVVECADALCREAWRRGSEDNCSVVMVKFD